MPLTAPDLAEVAAAELAAGLTAIVTPSPGQGYAISANGHWDYERVSPAMWQAWDRRRQRVACYAADANHARRQTFELDHPMCDHPRRESRPATYTVV